MSLSCSVISNSLRPHGLYSPWNSPGQNTGVGSRSLLQGIFPTQGLNPGLLHCRQILYLLSHKGSPGLDLGNITINKASGDDGISAQFQILKDDAVQVLHTPETNTTFLINYFLLCLVTKLCLTLLLQHNRKTLKNLLKWLKGSLGNCPLSPMPPERFWVSELGWSQVSRSTTNTFVLTSLLGQPRDPTRVKAKSPKWREAPFPSLFTGPQ